MIFIIAASAADADGSAAAIISRCRRLPLMLMRAQRMMPFTTRRYADFFAAHFHGSPPSPAIAASALLRATPSPTAARFAAAPRASCRFTV